MEGWKFPTTVVLLLEYRYLQICKPSFGTHSLIRVRPQVGVIGVMGCVMSDPQAVIGSPAQASRGVTDSLVSPPSRLELAPTTPSHHFFAIARFDVIVAAEIYESTIFIV